MSWREEKARRAKKLCRAACKAMGAKATVGAMLACEAAPWRAITCYRAVLHSLGKRVR